MGSKPWGEPRNAGSWLWGSCGGATSCATAGKPRWAASTTSGAALFTWWESWPPPWDVSFTTAWTKRRAGGKVALGLRFCGACAPRHPLRRSARRPLLQYQSSNTKNVIILFLVISSNTSILIQRISKGVLGAIISLLLQRISEVRPPCTCAVWSPQTQGGYILPIPPVDSLQTPWNFTDRSIKLLCLHGCSDPLPCPMVPHCSRASGKGN